MHPACSNVLTSTQLHINLNEKLTNNGYLTFMWCFFFHIFSESISKGLRMAVHTVPRALDWSYMLLQLRSRFSTFGLSTKSNHIWGNIFGSYSAVLPTTATMCEDAQPYSWSHWILYSCIFPSPRYAGNERPEQTPYWRCWQSDQSS